MCTDVAPPGNAPENRCASHFCHQRLDPMKEAPSNDGASLVSETPPSAKHRGRGTGDGYQQPEHGMLVGSSPEAPTSKEFSQLPTALTRKHASRFCLQPVNTGPRGQEQDTPILSPTQIRRQLW